jgi:hypothetical protein
MKVISFSLWGDKEMYTVGAIKNALLAQYYYFDYQCWFYIHEDSVPKNIIEQLSLLKNTKIIFKKGEITKCCPMMWRFEAIDDPNVEVMLSRDTDTRILLREKLAVEEWLNSDKSFHIMRDHPHHNFKILGGMFGTKKIDKINSWIDLINHFKSRMESYPLKNYDQDFLKEIIYPLIKDDSLIHSNFIQFPEENSNKFPLEYDKKYRFIGEYVYENDTRSESHILDLKNELKDRNNVKDKIHLITSFYITNNDSRNDELLECLYKNLNNEMICTIHLFVDNLDALNQVLQLQFNYQKKLNKIKIASIGVQPLYSDMFKYAIDNLCDQICMISNSDIYLHKCEIDLSNHLKDNIFALSRHEYDFKFYLHGVGSHDAFIFRPKYIKRDILKNIEHVQNIAGSDDNIINNLVDLGHKVYNPAFQIIIIHLHKSNIRTYSENKIAHGKYFIKQEYFNCDNKLDDDHFYDDQFVFYKGLDHFGDDLFIYSSNINDMKKVAYHNNNVKAFNTLGFMKSNFSIDKLHDNVYINANNGHGIFIKKNI